jgi:hypothetical protein
MIDELRRRAWALREQYRATGEPFTQTAFAESLRERCRDLGSATLTDVLVAEVAEEVDCESIRDSRPE